MWYKRVITNGSRYYENDFIHLTYILKSSNHVHLKTTQSILGMSNNNYYKLFIPTRNEVSIHICYNEDLFLFFITWYVFMHLRKQQVFLINILLQSSSFSLGGSTTACGSSTSQNHCRFRDFLGSSTNNINNRLAWIIITLLLQEIHF